MDISWSSEAPDGKDVFLDSIWWIWLNHSKYITQWPADRLFNFNKSKVTTKVSCVCEIYDLNNIQQQRVTYFHKQLCVSYGGHLSDIQIHWDTITFVFFNSEAFQGYYLINVILFLYTTSSLLLPLSVVRFSYHPILTILICHTSPLQLCLQNLSLWCNLF